MLHLFSFRIVSTILIVRFVDILFGNDVAPPFTYNICQSGPCPPGFLPGTDHHAPIFPNASSAYEEIIAWIPGFLNQTRDILQSPAASVIITHNGHQVYKKYSGSAKVHSQAPLNDRTGYWIASNTKVFTSTMLFMLRDAGKLPQGLDTPLVVLLPTFSVRTSYTSSRPITLRSLAMHASGLPREWPDCPGCNEKEILHAISNISVNRAQWTRTSYSNLGLALLGRALEKLVGVPWEQYVVEKILRPLGMRDSGVFGFGEPYSGMAEGVGPTGEIESLPTKTTWGAPCGEMYSTPADMALWGNFLMNTAATEEERLRQEMVLDFTTRAEMRNTGFFVSDGMSGISAATLELAFMRGRWSANKLGADPGFRSAITLIPELGLGIFAVATCSSDFRGDGDYISFPIASKLVPVLDQLMQTRAVRTEIWPPQELLANITGQYCSAPPAPGVQVVVESTGKRLVMRSNYDVELGYPFTLHWEGDNVFRMDMGDPPNSNLPESWPNCTSSEFPGQNLCPVSCNRRMFRNGDVLLTFSIDTTPGHWFGIMQMKMPGWECHKHSA